jgi:uncharacterized protein (TIGR00251 family)
VDRLIDIRGDGTVVIRVHVQPGANRTTVSGRHGDALKIAVTAPADAGRANEAVLRLVAEVTGVRRAAVRLVSGRTSRAKRIAIDGGDPAEIVQAIGNALAGPGVVRRRPS